MKKYDPTNHKPVLLALGTKLRPVFGATVQEVSEFGNLPEDGTMTPVTSAVQEVSP